MAVVVEQKSSVGRFDVNFGLDLWCSVLASSGPSGETMATPSTYSYSCPSNWNSWSLVAAFRRSTRSTLLRFKCC